MNETAARALYRTWLIKHLAWDTPILGKRCKLFKTGMERLTWGITHLGKLTQKFGNTTELYNYIDIDDALNDFIALEGVPERFYVNAN